MPEFEYHKKNGSGYGGHHPVEHSRPSDPDEIDLKQLFYTLWHHKWIIMTITFVAGAIALAVAYSMTPIYQSSGSLLITQSQNRIGSSSDEGLASMLSSTYGIGLGSTVANELQVLRSRHLSNLMAEELLNNPIMENGRMYPVLWQQWPVDSTVTAQDSVAMRIRGNIGFSRVDREADMISITYQSPSPYEAARMVDLSMDTYSELSTQQKRMAASSAVRFLEKERQRIEERLRKNEEQLRTFMNEHRLVQVDAQTEELITRMAELEGKRQEARTKLVAVNSAMEQYRNRLNNIKPGLSEQYAEAIGPQMSRLQYQLAELETERMLLLSENPGIEKDSQNPHPELRRIDEKMGMLRDRIRELTDDLLNQSDQYIGFLGNGEGNAAQAITELNQKLIELQIDQQQYQAQVEVIGEQLNEQQQFFENLPDNMIDMARLKREVAINEELFLTVSKQHSEMALWEQTQFGLGRQIDSGFIPDYPVSPNKKLFLLVGLVLGGILSVGYVMVKESFDTRIDSVEKMKKLRYPVLSVIPNLKPLLDDQPDGESHVIVNGRYISTDLMTVFDTISPFAEAFRRLSNNIRYSQPDRKLTTIAITSSKQGEGKTNVTANFATILAEAGLKVAAVDVDFRRSRLHQLWGLEQTPGLSDLLFDQAGAKQVIRQTVVDNVHVIPAGKEPPNPAALSESRKLLDFIDKLKETYDVVLLDTAPYGFITDAGTLLQTVDGVITIAQFNDTEIAEIEHTFENMEQINATILGTVLTAFDPEKSADYQYSSSFYKTAYKNYKAYN